MLIVDTILGDIDFDNGALLDALKECVDDCVECIQEAYEAYSDRQYAKVFFRETPRQQWFEDLLERAEIYDDHRHDI